MSEPVPGRNVSDLVGRAAQANPARPAVVCGEACLTWAELDREIDALAAGLAERLPVGERVGLALASTPAFALTYFAVARAGLVAVPVNTGYTAAELSYLMADSRPSLVFFDRSTERVVAELAGTGRLGATPVAAQGEAVGAVGDAVLAADLTDPRAASGPPRAGAEDPAVILYTSGTSGRPRGAMLSHRALLANLAQIARLDPPVVSADDVVLLAPPLFHVFGLNAGLGTVARTGATAVLVPRFDPEATLAEVRRRGVSTVLAAPPMYLAWSRLPETTRAFADVRLAVCGAAALPTEVDARMRRLTGRPVHQGYGLTEAAPVLTATLASGSVKPGSVGRPLPGVALRLVDESTGEQVADGDPGEVVVRGANLFSGYWPDGAGGPDGDGWFATGDLAYADADGDLFLVGRRYELILVNGFNVYPAEVEAVLNAHPAVAESAVLGAPDPKTGEIVRALVVRRPGVEVGEQDLIEYAAGSLARFKCPTVIEFVDALPHSGAGKVAKGRLAADPPPGDGE